MTASRIPCQLRERCYMGLVLEGLLDEQGSWL